MKHIKNFKTLEEQIDMQVQKYYLNEYVELCSSGFKDNKPRYGKIIKVEPPQYNSIIFYNVEIYGVDNIWINIWISNDRIERTLDKNEIERYKLDITSKKYNI